MNNGDKMPVEVPMERPLSRKAQELRDAHYRDYAEAIEQRDAALQENEHAKQLCVSAKHEINALHEQISELKGRCAGYQLERDQAVAKFAALEGFFISLLAQMHAHKIPEAPPQTVATDAEAPVLELNRPKPGSLQEKRKIVGLEKL